MTTYPTASAVLGKAYVQHLWRQPRGEDGIAEVQRLKSDCEEKGLQSRAEAYGVILAAMEDVRDKAAAQR